MKEWQFIAHVLTNRKSRTDLGCMQICGPTHVQSYVTQRATKMHSSFDTAARCKEGGRFCDPQGIPCVHPKICASLQLSSKWSQSPWRANNITTLCEHFLFIKETVHFCSARVSYLCTRGGMDMVSRENNHKFHPRPCIETLQRM